MEYATAGPRVTFVTIPGSYSGYPWAEHGRNVNQTYSLSWQRKWLDDASTMHFCNSAAKFAHSVSAVSRGRTDIPEVRAGESWGAGGRPSLFEECHKDRGWAFLRKRTHQELPVLGRVKHPNSPLECFFFTSPILSKLQECYSKQRTWQYETICSWGELLIIVGRQMPSWWQFCSLWVNWVQQLPSSRRQ